MDRARWRDRAALSALLLIAMMSTAVTPAAISASLRPAAPAAVDCRSVTPAAAARAALASTNARAATVRIQAQLARRGELTGRVMTAQTTAGAPLSVVLPAESFVGPAVGDLIVYTRHSAGRGSEVRTVNLATGCDTLLASPPEIARSAVLDPAASAVYVHSVTRAGRADAGVVGYDLATGKSASVLPPLRAPEGFGPVFATDLSWDVDGRSLAVQSCGFSQCLTRVLDTASGAIATMDRPGQGGFIGLTRTHLLTFAGCPGLPCAVLSTDVVTGSVSVVADEAFAAELQPTAGGAAVLKIETSAGEVEVSQ
jgi:hypothetical protein